jgi:Tfp pilus assembly protein PilZ
MLIVFVRNIKLPVFITETEGVYGEVGIEYLYVIELNVRAEKIKISYHVKDMKPSRTNNQSCKNNPT